MPREHCSQIWGDSYTHTQRVRSNLYSTLYLLQRNEENEERKGRTSHQYTTNESDTAICSQKWITPGGPCGLKEFKTAKIKMSPAGFHTLSSTSRSEHNAVLVSCTDSNQNTVHSKHQTRGKEPDHPHTSPQSCYSLSSPSNQF